LTSNQNGNRLQGSGEDHKLINKPLSCGPGIKLFQQNHDYLSKKEETTKTETRHENKIDSILFSFQFMHQILHQLTMFFEIQREE